MNQMKITDYYEFHSALKMHDFSQESLSKRDLALLMDDKNLTLEDLLGEWCGVLARDLPARNYDFNLKGIVVHIGTAEQGHYFSYAQDREQAAAGNKWFEFNDYLVREFNPEDIANKCFGSENESFVQP